MSTTTENSSIVTKFLEKKYADTLGEIIANIKASTVNQIKVLISEDGKSKGMPTSVVPLKDDVDTGFGCVKEMLERGDFPLTDNTLLVCYLSSKVGKEFTTTYFQDALKPLPDRQFSGFTITLSERVLNQLDDIELSETPKKRKYSRNSKNIGMKKNLSEKIKVKFVYSDGENGTEDPIIFSLWFAGKLAKKYLSWCKQDLLVKKENSATISKSAADKSGHQRLCKVDSDS